MLGLASTSPKRTLRKNTESRDEVTLWEAQPDTAVPFSADLDSSNTSQLTSSATVRREYNTIQTVFLRLKGAPPLDAELCSLPISKVGSYLFSVYNTRKSCKENDRVSILWEVSMEGGRRVLTLQSAVEIENSSGYPLEIRQVGVENKEEEKIIPVDVAYKVRLPLAWTVEPDINLQLRPRGYSGYNWSADLCYGPSDVKNFVVCPYMSPPDTDEGVADGGKGVGSSSSTAVNQKPLVFQLEAIRKRGKEDATGQEALRGRGETVCFRIFASATLVNMLPAPVRYAWREAMMTGSEDKSSDNRVEVGQLLSGEERALHNVHLLAADVEMCFKIDGLHRSEWVPIRYRDSKGLVQVKLLDDFGNTFSVNLEMNPNGHHGLTVTIFVDYWVQNLTNLPLVLGEPLPQTEGLEGVFDVVASAVQVSDGWPW